MPQKNPVKRPNSLSIFGTRSYAGQILKTEEVLQIYLVFIIIL